MQVDLAYTAGKPYLQIWTSALIDVKVLGNAMSLPCSAVCEAVHCAGLLVTEHFPVLFSYLETIGQLDII